VDTWFVKRGGRGRMQIQGFFGPEDNLSQYFALHTESGYIRFVPSPECGWGTSVVIVPSFWSGGLYRQGMRCSASWDIVGTSVNLIVSARSEELSVEARVSVKPPIQRKITATVSVKLEGDLSVDDRPREAFKPVVLASMHTSAGVFDATAAFAGLHICPLLPGQGILPPKAGISAASFGLVGGSSHWKINAPTVTVEFDHAVQVAGWSTEQTDPNGDNISLWAASPEVMREWNYDIVTSPVYPISGEGNEDLLAKS
jgi:hypothetical protein